jgi:hypothetical protein
MPVEVGEVATPNHDPHHVTLTPTEVAEVATPNHDPHHVSLMPAAAAAIADGTTPWNTVLLWAEPKAAEPSAPVFVAADTMLYARANARLRAAPSTTAGVLAKLVASAPLRAIARSTDGVWWQVSFAGMRTGYVHRDAVTKYPLVTAKPAATAPVAAASPESAPTPSRQGLLGFADDAMNWLVDVVGQPHGTPPKVIRTER